MKLPVKILIFLAAAAMAAGCKSSKYHDPELTAAFAEAETENQENSQDEDSPGPGISISDIPDSESPVSDEGENDENETSYNPSSARLLFAGDILFSDHVLNAYEKAGSITGVLDEGYLNVISSADYFVANEEFPFSSRGQAAPDKQYTFRLPEEKVSMMNELGVDLVTLANNHALDFGTDALLDTCSTLDGAGILHVGAGANSEEARKPQIVELNGIRVGFIGASRVIPVASWTAGASTPGMLTAYDDTLLLQTIEETRPLCDYLIVYLHWGVEREEMPVDHQTALGRRCIDAGADLVIGSHPHVLQGLEYYDGKPIVYSLGNFIFGSSIPKTMLLELTLEENGENVRDGEHAGNNSGVRIEETDSQSSGNIGDSGITSDSVSVPLNASLRLIPGTSAAGHTRKLSDSGEIAEFYRYIERISFDISIGENGTVSSQR